jgi:hypothetical protein
VPKEQSAEHHRLGRSHKRRAPPVTSAHERQNDRASNDDEGADDDGDEDDDRARKLPTFVRFADIRAAGIVGSYEQLYQLIDKEGFPPGVMLSPNVRAWRIDLVERWLGARPVERKPVPDAWPEERREAAKKKRAAQQRADADVSMTMSTA